MRNSSFGAAKQLGGRGILQIILHLPKFLKLFFRLFKDPRVSLAPKLVPLSVLVYLMLPFDLLPDVLLGLGQIDDLLVILLGLRFFLRLCPSEVVQEHVKAIAAGR